MLVEKALTGEKLFTVLTRKRFARSCVMSKNHVHFKFGSVGKRPVTDITFQSWLGFRFDGIVDTFDVVYESHVPGKGVRALVAAVRVCGVHVAG